MQHEQGPPLFLQYRIIGYLKHLKNLQSTHYSMEPLKPGS